MTMANEPDASPASETRAAELEALIAARTAQLWELASYLQISAEAEHSALAKELHHELGGLITAAKMDMAWLTAHLGASLDAAGEEKCRAIVQMLNQAMMLKRRVVESLRPSLLDHFGLPVALRTHFEEHCARACIECVATLTEEPLELPEATQLALFRVAQEALAGVLARGSAKHVELVFEADGDGYSLLVGDDAAVPGDAQRRLFVGMRVRMQSVGGTLETEAAPGQGNRIRAYVPRSRAGSG